MIKDFLNPTFLFSVTTSLIGGYWVLKNSILKRDFHPKLEINSDLSLEINHNDDYFGLIKIKISNRGNVRLYFDRAHFSLSCIKNDELLKFDKNREIPRVMFENKLLEKISLFPRKWKYSYVEPNSSNTYNFSFLFPKEVKYILLTSKIYLKEERSDFISDATYFRVLDSGEIKKL